MENKEAAKQEDLKKLIGMLAEKRQTKLKDMLEYDKNRKKKTQKLN